MDQFIQQLLSEQGVPENMDPEQRRLLSDELMMQATDFLNRRMLEAMSEEAVNEFNTLLDDESVDPQRVQDFVMNHVEDRENVAARALVEFRALYLGAKA